MWLSRRHFLFLFHYHVWLLSSKIAARIKKLRKECGRVFVSLQEEVTRCRVSRPTVYQGFNWSERAKQAENKIRDDTQWSRSSCADTEMQNPTAACEDPLSLSCALARMHTGQHS